MSKTAEEIVGEYPFLTAGLNEMGVWNDYTLAMEEYASIKVQEAKEEWQHKLNKALSYVQGGIDGLGWDKDCEVIEKSFVIEQLKDIESLLKYSNKS